MRAFSFALIAALSLAVALPAAAETAVNVPAEGQLLLAQKGDKERGRGEGRRDRDSGYRSGDSDHQEHGERRRISRGEAAQRARRGNPGRVLGIDESQGESQSEYEVRILDGGRLRTIRVPAEDEDD